LHRADIDGKPPVPGQIYRNPDLAKALRLLQAEGADAFYRGAIAKAIVAKSSAVGGTMTFDDLAFYKGEWQEPAHSVYHGHDIYELPPPSQAWAALEMLNVLEACVPRWAPGQTLASLGPRSPEYWHYAPFGSGLTVPGYGFILHDRGALFSLDPASPNLIAPHKRPFNTLSAGFVMDGERPRRHL
jgi:gamma-glutamyltranspeptidase